MNWPIVAQVAQPAVSPTASRQRGQIAGGREGPGACGLATRETADSAVCATATPLPFKISTRIPKLNHGPHQARGLQAASTWKKQLSHRERIDHKELQAFMTVDALTKREEISDWPTRSLCDLCG